MKDIIDWLVNLEQISEKLYSESAYFFSGDPGLKSFLDALEHDEESHKRIIIDSLGRMQSMNKLPGSVIRLDDDLKLRIEWPIIENQRLLKMGLLTKEQLFETIVSTEFSEWNDIFIYAVESLKSNGADFQRIAPVIERHKKRIENFFNTLEGGAVYLDAIQNLKSLWKWRILVVDDDESVRNFLMTVCGREGEVDSAGDGSEALSKMADIYYDLVISDISMPNMDGIELYETAVQSYKQIGKRMLYFSSTMDQHEDFIKRHDLKVLEKPASVSDIRRAILDVLLR